MAKNASDQTGADTLKALQQLGKIETKYLKTFVGEFSSRYNKPMEDRTWKWTLTFTDFTPQDVLVLFAHLFEWKDPAKSWLMEPARSFQSTDEQKLWTVLKSRPKGRGGGAKKGGGGRK